MRNTRSPAARVAAGLFGTLLASTVVCNVPSSVRVDFDDDDDDIVIIDDYDYCCSDDFYFVDWWW
jgi:hypothetical protein